MKQMLILAQDYFSKWPFAITMPDQTAQRIIQILRDKLFTLVRHVVTQNSVCGSIFKKFSTFISTVLPYVLKKHKTEFYRSQLLKGVQP